MALSSDGTYLVNTFTNQPVFIVGDDAFAMDGNLSDSDLETYLSDRASKGFNLIWISVVDNVYSINPPNDFLGNAPFSGGDFLNMQEAYFSQLDYVIQRAAAYGITVLLNPAFSGNPCNGGGWCPEMEAASDATMTAYGSFLGNRYKNYSNIIWLIGGDAEISQLGSALKNKLNDIAVGIRSADTVHLMTAENIRGQSALDEWSGASWLGLNALYNVPSDFPAAANANYTRPDFLPFFELEDWYEGEHSMTPLGLRTEAYWAVLSGAYLGGLFGNNAIWPFGDSWDTMGQTWQSQLGSTGSVQRSIMGKLFRSREHWKMVPDINHTVVTAGYGSGQTLTVASRTSDGQTIIAYIPNGNATTITVDLTKITSQSQQANCAWFNPSTGATTQIGVFPNTGSHNFTAPDSNDWVLLIDDAGSLSVQVSPSSATLQQSGTQTFTATVAGSTAGVTWSIQPQVGTLSANGQSASYTAPSSITSQQTVTVTATSVADSTKFGTANVTLTVNAGAPSITSAGTAIGTVGAAFSYQIAATNNPTSYGATGLPAGLSINSSTGLISGTPTASGVSSITLRATNSSGTGTAPLSLTVNSSAAAAFLQVAAGASPGAAKVFSLAFPGSTAAGDLILVGFDFDTNSTPSSVTDSQGNTFTEVGTQLITPGGVRTRVYYAKAIKGGADTVTVNLSANSAWIEMYLAEYSGVDQVNPVDVQAGASGSSNTVSSGNATTTAAGDVIFGYCVGDSACTVGSGFAARSTFNHNLIEDVPAGSPGSSAAKGSANNGWTMQMVALRSAGASQAMPAITSPSTANGAVGSSFSYQITATNNPTSFGASGLPAGLSINTATGLISGTLNSTGTTPVTLSASNSTGAGTATLTVTTSVVAPVITSSSSATGTVGNSFSYQITASNSPTSFGATGLPAGLSINSATGLVSGAPTATGTSTVTLNASNSAGTGSATLTLSINPAVPVITSASTASGTVGVAFSYQITASNSPTSFGATGLPAGLSINNSTGVISGTPTASATTAVTMSATNAAGTSTATLTLTVNRAVPAITSANTASGTVGKSLSYQITASNSPTSFGATGLPAGLSVNTTTGVISGTPSVSGQSLITLSATNAAGTGTGTLTLTVNAATPAITSSSTASATVGSAFSYQITATNNPTSFGATGLPSGLSISSTTGLISGTPAASGTSSVTLSAANGAGTGRATLTLTVNATVSFSFLQVAAGATPGAATAFSRSFPANTVAGDLILVAFDFDTNATPTSVTDSQGNTFTQVGAQLTSPGGARSRVYYAKAIKGGADTVTVNLSANSAWIELYLAEYSGVDQVNPVDAQAGASGNSGAVSSGGATTTVAGDVIFGYCVGDSACTTGSGFTARSTFNHNLIEDVLAGNPGSYAAKGSANNGWTMQMVALKPAGH